MKITFRLVDQNGDEKFRLEQPSTDIPTYQQRALSHFQDYASVVGLRYGLTGSGLITLKANADQLTPDVVEAIRKSAEAALKHAAESSKE